MTSSSLETQTGTQRLHVTMRDSPSLRTASGFGETFRDLDSLMFVSALQVELERAEHGSFIVSHGESAENDPGMVEIVPTIDLGFAPSLDVFSPYVRDPVQIRSANLIDRAIDMTRLIRVERVSYQSPLEIILSFVQQTAEYSGVFGPAGLLFIGGAGSTILVANRAIKFWNSLSDARIKHAEANQAAILARQAEAKARASQRVFELEVSNAEIEARIREAEARTREEDAKLRASEVDLKLEAHNIIRENLRMVQTIYEAESASRLDPSKSTGALLQELDQAAASLASIEDMKFIES